jgi:hypothetical protein
MIISGSVRIIAETAEAVRALATAMGVVLTTVKEGREGGWIGYGTKAITK